MKTTVYLIFFFISFIPIQLIAQGCMPARHIPPNLGNDAKSFLADGEWEAGISYQFLNSRITFTGTEPYQAFIDTGLSPKMFRHYLNLSIRYSINARLSISLNVPLLQSIESIGHQNNEVYSINTGMQLGDVRLNANYWVLDPTQDYIGNWSVGIGIKAPTGNSELEGEFYYSDGSRISDLDIAQQPGDGGWGIQLETYMFQILNERYSVYAAGFYMINPRNTNDSQPPWIRPWDLSRPPVSSYRASVPDQFSLQAGINTGLGRDFSLRTGFRFDGIPVNDLIGKSDGDRRPGSIFYFDPGIVYSNFENTLNLNIPVALRREILSSNFDTSLGEYGAGGLAGFLVIFGYVRRF